MTPNSGASTRTVQPTPQFDSLRANTAEPNSSAEVPMSPEVRAEIERRFLDLLSKLNDRDIGHASLSEAERKVADSALELFGENTPNLDWFSKPDVEEPAAVETQAAAQLSPEARIVAGIEQLTPEGCYQVFVQMTSYAMKLREYGSGYPDRVREAVQSDFELTA